MRRSIAVFSVVLVLAAAPMAALASATEAEGLALNASSALAPVAGHPDDAYFPVYPALEPQVAFWKRVFGEYSEHHSVIHSAEFPHKIFTVIDFRAEALRLDAHRLERLRAKEERLAKERGDRLLKSVHRKRGQPETMTPEERKIFDLFADVADDRRFIKLVGTLRAQRGLRERTQKALETSGRYLPEMERTFARYQLPTTLTRLPLVESSFNVEAYSKVGAAGLWQFIPSSARIYMRLNEVVDDRRDPWASTDAAARHLRDDYDALGDWPLALTAYNHGRSGVAKALRVSKSSSLPQVIERYRSQRFGFATRNFYTSFLAAVQIDRDYQAHFGELQRQTPLSFDVVQTQHYVPFETLQRLSGTDQSTFLKLNPAYRPEVVEGKLYVPPGHSIRVPTGSLESFQLAYAGLPEAQLHKTQRSYYLAHTVRRGEVLGRIARRYGVSVATLKHANGLKSDKTLRIGQVLKVPPRHEAAPHLTQVSVPAARASLPQYHEHRVRSGESLTSIARRYKVTIADLRAANNLGRSSAIKAGSKLRVPTKS